jgi:hypothetical protein
VRVARALATANHDRTEQRIVADRSIDRDITAAAMIQSCFVAVLAVATTTTVVFGSTSGMPSTSVRVDPAADGYTYDGHGGLSAGASSR